MRSSVKGLYFIGGSAWCRTEARNKEEGIRSGGGHPRTDRNLRERFEIP